MLTLNGINTVLLGYNQLLHIQGHFELFIYYAHQNLLLVPFPQFSDLRPALTFALIEIFWRIPTKAELLQEGIVFLIHLFARDVLVMKELEIQKTKPTFIYQF